MFDALMTDEDKVKQAEDDRRAALTVPISASGEWAKATLRQAAQVISMVAGLTESRPLQAIAAGVFVLAQEATPVPMNCEHFKDVKVDVFVSCSNCYDDRSKAVIHFPCPTIVVNSEFDDTNPQSFKYMAAAYGLLTVPKRIGFMDTFEGAMEVLSHMDSEEHAFAFKAELDALDAAKDKV